MARLIVVSRMKRMSQSIDVYVFHFRLSVNQTRDATQCLHGICFDLDHGILKDE